MTGIGNQELLDTTVILYIRYIWGWDYFKSQEVKRVVG